MTIIDPTRRHTSHLQAGACRVVAVGDLANQNSQLHGANEKLRDENRRLKAELYTDMLTQMLSRRGATAYLDAIMEYLFELGSLAVYCLDADHFKDVNDKYGHPVGDEFLRQLSARIRKGTRGIANGKSHKKRIETMPNLVAKLAEEGLPLDPEIRYGGEELLILVPLGKLIQNPYIAAAKIGKRLCDLLCDEPYDLTNGLMFKDDKSLILSKTVSMGISVLDCETLQNNILDGPIDVALGKLAAYPDNALYLAKEFGRASVGMNLPNGEDVIIYMHPKSTGRMPNGSKINLSPLQLAA